MTRQPRLASALAVLVLSGWATACAPDHAPPPPDRDDLAERQARLDEVSARLEEISDATVGTCLIHTGHPDDRVRRAAILRLMEIGEPSRRVVPDLIALLSDDAPRVRTAAARALGALADRRAIDPLIAALVDENAEVRLFVWKALRRHGSAAHARLVFHLGPDSPIADLSRTDDQGRKVSLRGELRSRLPRVGKPIVPHLLAAMENGEEGLVVNILRVLWQIGPDAVEAVPTLVKLLETGNQEIRFQATRALGAVGDIDPAVLPALHRASKDKTDQVRRTANRALKDIADTTRAGKKKHPRQGADRSVPEGARPAVDRDGGPVASEAEPVEGDLPD